MATFFKSSPLFFCLLIFTSLFTSATYTADFSYDEIKQIDAIVQEACRIAKNTVSDMAWVADTYIINAIESEVRSIVQNAIKAGNLAEFMTNFAKKVRTRSHEIWDDMAYGVYKPFKHNHGKTSFD